MSRKSASHKSTIFDVAEMAGVSIKTVSRVVNKEPNVRIKTREKVLEAVARLQYQPNTAARGLSGARSFVIGLVYENPHEFSYIGAVLNGALAACESEGYSLLLRPITLPDPDLAESVRGFAQQARHRLEIRVADRWPDRIVAPPVHQNVKIQVLFDHADQSPRNPALTL